MTKIEERKKRALRNTLKLMAAHQPTKTSDEFHITSNPVIEREFRRVKQDSKAGNIDQEYIERLIKRSLRWSLNEIPILSSDIFALLRYLGSNASMSTLEHSIIKHPDLCIHIIDVANQSEYRGRTPVTSVRTAMVRIGISKLKHELYQAILNNYLFKNKTFKVWVEKIRFRTYVSTKFAEEILKISGSDLLYEDVFLHIFLHDIGEVYILQIIDLMQIKIYEGEIYNIVHKLHTEVGEELLKRLRLKEAAMIAQKHHNPLISTTPYSVIIASATDQLSFHFKLTLPPKWIIEKSNIPFRMLGLNSNQINTLYEKSELILENILEQIQDF